MVSDSVDAKAIRYHTAWCVLGGFVLWQKKWPPSGANTQRPKLERCPTMIANPLENGKVPFDRDHDVPANDLDRLTGVNQPLEWADLDVDEQLEFILGNTVRSAWMTPEAIETLTNFRNIPQTWGLIKARYAEIYGSPKDLEKAVDMQLKIITGRIKAAQEAVHSIWDEAESLASYLAHEDHALDADARDLVVPGCITIIAAPRASLKSILMLAIAKELATGGVFRGERVPQRRVLLLDRDNPPALLRQRLRSLHIPQDATLKVMDRQKAPSLLDKAAWEALPADQYDVIVVDSLGAFTEGVSEKEGRQTQEFLALLRTLAARGPAILLLDNTNKAGEGLRGRGEKPNAVDIIYEVRNITNWTPPTRANWWEALPESGEYAWQQRASRRANSEVTRLAFTPSKFRIGTEPEPFVLQIDLRQKPWAVADITEEFELEADDNAKSAADEARAKAKAAEHTLIMKLHEGAMRIGDAETFLRGIGLQRNQARNLLNAGNRDLYPSGRWVIREEIGTKGKPKMVSLCREEDDGGNNNGGNNPSKNASQETLISASGSAPSRRKSASIETSIYAGENGTSFPPPYKQDTAEITTYDDRINTVENSMDIISADSTHTHGWNLVEGTNITLTPSPAESCKHSMRIGDVCKLCGEVLDSPDEQLDWDFALDLANGYHED